MQALYIPSFYKHRYSYLALILCFIVYVWTVLNIQSYKNHQVLKWDAFGYYLYLPAIFIYNGSDDTSFASALNEKYAAADGRIKYGVVTTGSGEKIFKFTSGLSILYLPFFLIAHLYSSMSAYPADGFSMPYQFMIAVAGIFYAIVGLLFLFKILIRYFSDVISAIIILVIALGTNYFHYVVSEPGMAHVYLYALISMLIYFSIKWHQTLNWRYAIVIGIITGIAVLVRPSEIVIILIPLLWGLNGTSNLTEHFKKLWRYRYHILSAAAIVILIGAIQLIYWKYITDHFIVDSYKNEGYFDFTNPHFWNGLFSFKKGWLIYTPIMIFAIAGIFLLPKKLHNIQPLLIMFLILNAYIILSWNPWWYGGSFGHRAFIESYALLALPLAALTERAKQKKWLFSFILVIFFTLTALNVVQSVQSRKGIMSGENMTKEKYWDIFFRID